MPEINNIITIGISPCRDILCKGKGLQWGAHQVIDEQSSRAAGKALNVSRALAWMGVHNTAMGLWGEFDLGQTMAELNEWRRFLRGQFTPVGEQTRQNITLADTAASREMHLRAKSHLANAKSLKQLKKDIRKEIHKNTVCVFSGALPEEFTDEILDIIQMCQKRGGRIVLDSSGKAFKAILNEGGIWLIKPNVEELAELTGASSLKSDDAITQTAQELLDKTEMVLVSEGKRGARLVSSDMVIHGRLQEKLNGLFSGKIKLDKPIHTVGCGDCMLAGFIAGMTENGSADYALTTAIQAGTANAFGWLDSGTWSETRRKIAVTVETVKDEPEGD